MASRLLIALPSAQAKPVDPTAAAAVVVTVSRTRSATQTGSVSVGRAANRRTLRAAVDASVRSASAPRIHTAVSGNGTISVSNSACRIAKAAGSAVVCPRALGKSAVRTVVEAVVVLAGQIKSARTEPAKLPGIPARAWIIKDVATGIPCTGAIWNCSNRWSALNPAVVGALISAIMIATNLTRPILQESIP